MVANRGNGEKKKGFFALLGAAILFGSTGAFVTTLGAVFTEPGQLIVRSAIAVAMVVALSRLLRMRFNIQRSQVKYLVAVGVLYAVSTSCFVYAVTSVKATTALFMLYVGVIIVTQVLGALLFREGFGRKNIIALILLAVAFLAYLQPFSSASLSVGLLVAFAGGAFEALSYVVRKARNDMTKESITAAQSLGGLAIGLVFLGLNAQSILHTTLTIPASLLMIVLGAIYVGIGYLITYGMRHYSLGMGSVVLSSDLLFAVGINTVFLRQAPTAFEAIGSMLLFACIVYTTDLTAEQEGDDLDDDSEGDLMPAQLSELD